ncbi:MAG TPA: hypothetical protein VGP25_04780 [Gemmatimonadaceae bacterium]|nr:hypothetical protein [Gemmatimonadaceae bacterium]
MRSVSDRPDVALVHLVRAVNGVEPFRQFIRSYDAHRAGCDHELVLLCKGFERPELPPDWIDALGATAASLIFFSDAGMDIWCYFKAASRLRHRYLCFVNSWSRILADDWLAKLYHHGTMAGVGLVGASGAWFSLYTTNLLHHRQQSHLAADAGSDESRLDALRQYFPPFPNPYVRSNGFLIERSLFRSLRGGRGPTKIEGLLFELGADSMTRQVIARDLKVLVVGRDGLAYDPESWPASRTFRSGAQENLLVSDNRTEMYARADGAAREALAWTTWGDAARDEAPTRLESLASLELDRIPAGARIFVG